MIEDREHRTLRRSERGSALAVDPGSELVWRSGLTALVLIAFALRGWKGELTQVIARDGVAYLEQARALAEGRWSAGLGGYYPPLFPALTAPLLAILNPEAAGRLVSALAGALAVIPLARIARRSFDASAGLLAAAALAVLPRAIILGGEVLSDSLFLLMILIAADLTELTIRSADERQEQIEPDERRGSPLPAAIGAGLAAGGAALTRPEGLILPALLAIIVAARGQGGSARLPSGRLWLAALLVLGVGLSVFAIRPLALRSETGAWRLTRKAGVALGGYARLAAEERRHVPVLHRQLSAERQARQEQRPAEDDLGAAPRLLIEAPGLVFTKLARDGGALLLRLPVVVHPLLLLIALAALGDPERRARLGRHSLAVIAVAQSLIVVLAAASVEKRYLLPVAAWTSLATGVALADWLRGVTRDPLEASSSTRLAAWFHALRPTGRLALCLVIGLLVAAPALRSERTSRLGVRALAATLAESSKPGEGVVALSPRVAFYAERRALALPFCASAGELTEFQRRRGAPWLVLREGRQGPRLPWLGPRFEPGRADLERGWRRVARVDDLELWRLKPAEGEGR